MINHELIDEALLAWPTAMGLQSYVRDQAEPAIRMSNGGDNTKIAQAIASVKFISTSALGIDELRTAENDLDEDMLDPTVTGHRVMTVSCQVKSIRARAPSHAFALAERLRTRLRMPTTKAAFKAAGIALADATSITDLSYEDENGRVIGLAGFDVRLNVAAAETDSTLGTIGTVELSSNWRGEDGELLPAEHQLNDLQIEIDP
jgi:hypothetical protein